MPDKVRHLKRMQKKLKNYINPLKLKSMKTLNWFAIIIIAVFFTSCGGNGNKEESSSSNENETTQTDKTSGTFKDIRDGKEYKWVKIGKFTWMAENLLYDHGKQSGDYQYYETDCPGAMNSNCDKYGRLYITNSFDFPLADDPDLVSPKGWHVATADEWNDLVETIGNNEKLIENLNSKGFNVQMAGYVGLGKSDYIDTGEKAYYWATTSGSNYMKIVIDETGAQFTPISNISNDRHYLYTLRCVKDN